MKSLKNFIMVIAVLAMLPLMSVAQKTEKIICKNEECVLVILEKLRSQDKAVVSEAKEQVGILVNNVRFTGDSDMKNALKNSILMFVEKFSDCEGNEYLFSVIPMFCNRYDTEDIIQLVDRDEIADAVIRCLGNIPGSQDVIMQYIESHRDNLEHKAALAYAVGKLNISSMENELISWLKDADDTTKIEIYNALLVIRSNEKTTAIVEKGAKKLNKSKNVDNKIAGMRLLTALNGENAMPMLYKALKNKDARVRREALELIKPYANDEVVKNVVKKCKKGDAVVDALDWLGDIKNDTQMEFVMKQFSSTNPKAVEAAIRAVFKIDNPEGIDGVKSMFGGQYQEVIKESMISYEGDYGAVLNDVMRHGNANQQYAALQILECRPIMNVNNRVKELLNSANPKVKDEAFKVLKLVMPMAETQYLMTLLEYCDDKYVEDVQIAIKNATANMPAEKKDEFASTLKHVKADVMPRYYNVFAYFGTELCVDKLIDAYQNGAYKFEAKKALLLVENEQFQERINNVLK